MYVNSVKYEVQFTYKIYGFLKKNFCLTFDNLFLKTICIFVTKILYNFEKQISEGYFFLVTVFHIVNVLIFFRATRTSNRLYSNQSW